MKLTEYRSKLKEIDTEASKKKEKIHIEYAKANNPYRKGDILEDHYQIIRVDEISFSISNGVCSCIYKGLKLTKSLKPFKSGEVSIVYQKNVERKLR